MVCFSRTCWTGKSPTESHYSRLANLSCYYRYAYLFYLSKYYEFIDTVILVAKNRHVSLLQSYHHTGAVLTMFLLYKAGTIGVWIFVIFNSFIHTIMYFYYALTTMGINPPGKQMITSAQITQFLIGTVSAPKSFVYLVSIMNVTCGLQ